MRKVRKSLIRRRNSSAEDHDDYRSKSKEIEEEEEEEEVQVRPRCNSKHSYLARVKSKSDEEVFLGGTFDRRSVFWLRLFPFENLGYILSFKFNELIVNSRTNKNIRKVH